MTKIVKLNFCTLDINSRDNIVIGTINEGVHLTSKLSQIIVLTIFKYLGDLPMVYITNRVNSYSVDPTMYKTISKIKNLVGFGVVCPKNIKADIAKIEKLFYSNKFQEFKTLDEAMIWAKKLLKN